MAPKHLNRSLGKQLAVLLQDHFSINKHWKSWRANVLDLGTHSASALVSGKEFRLLSKNVAKVHLDLSLNQNLFVQRILLGSLLRVLANVSLDAVLCGDLGDALDEFIDI